MKILIEFNSVFDAARGVEIMNSYKMKKYQRDHDHGSIIFEIDQKDYDMLKKNNIGFEKLNL